MAEPEAADKAPAGRGLAKAAPARDSSRAGETPRQEEQDGEDSDTQE